ncbi:MAG: hypothetical protein JKY50_00265 [Oleispira sp.]|nr:hypothetical protein [Oleispira sp.]
MKYLTDDVVSGLSRASITMGRDSGVRVVFKGERAYTDGRVITLPAMPSGETITQEQVSVIRGYSDHESGHIRHTDMHDYQRWAKINHKNEVLMELNNCIEDVRIERKIKSEYAGSNTNLNTLNSVMGRETLERWDEVAEQKDVNDPKTIGPMSMKWEENTRDGITSATECLDKVGDSIKDHAKNWVDAIEMCRNSRDSQRLAEYIYEQLDKDPELEQEPEPIPQDMIQNGEDGELDQEDEQPNGGPEEGQGGHGSKYVEEGEEGDSEGTDKGGYGASDPSEVKFSDGDPTKIVEEMFPPEPSGGKVVITPDTTEYDYWHTPKDSTSSDMQERYKKASQHGMESYTEAFGKCSTTVHMLRSKITRYLKAKELRDWDVGRHSGRLDTRRLVSAYNGAPNVFKVRSEREEINTAISIFVDLSGSMDGSKAYAARDCCVALAEALEPTMFKYTINGFSTYLGKRGYHDAEGDNIRVGSLDLIQMKSWDQRLFEAKPYIGYIPQFVLSDNNDPESILWCASDLKKRPEAKKVMIVLSDGHPATSIQNETEHSVLSTATKNAVQRCTDDGIHMIGIGIESSAVEMFYPNSMVVHKVGDLGDRVMDQILALTK